MENNNVLLITGMDRSGTSWVAGALQASGVFMGKRMYRADRGNPLGHFEDEEFLEFQIGLLQAADLEGLYRYSTAGTASKEIPISEENIQRAQNLIESRAGYPLWGFKDPRTTLLLDFWKERLPGMKVICLYRSPLETSLSLFNRGDGFANLRGVFDAFQHRMENVLAFKKNNPRQMILANIHRVIAHPDQFEQKIAERLEISLPGLATNLRQNFDPKAFSEISPGLDTLVKFYQLFPEAARLFENLEKEADLPRYGKSNLEQSQLAAARAETVRPGDATLAESDLKEAHLEFFISLVEDGLASQDVRKKIIVGLLENVKILGGVQDVHSKEIATLSEARNRLAAQLADRQAQLSVYETHFQSQDLMTRHLINLTFNNLLDIVRNPARIRQKLNRWIDHRIRRGPAPSTSPTTPNRVLSRSTAGSPNGRHTAASFSSTQKKWLKQARAANPEAISILHPEWLGIRSSTLNLIPTHLFVDDTLDEIKAHQIAHLLSQTGCGRFVFSGFAVTHGMIIEALQKIDPEFKIFVLWHGNFLQSSETYNWQAFHRAERLYKQGHIYKWGFVKKGMAEEMAALGYRTGFVMNYIGKIPSTPALPLAQEPTVGIWGAEWNWRKYPYAMLAACGLIPEATGHFYGAGEKAIEFVETLGLNVKLYFNAVPQAKMPEKLKQFHLNLYVTLSECAPMLPLESLSVGVPCLTGPTSHLFEDNKFLHQMLVVPYPDSASAIAQYGRRALEKRDEIIQAYREYGPEYNERAKASLAEFLEIG